MKGLLWGIFARLGWVVQNAPISLNGAWLLATRSVPLLASICTDIQGLSLPQRYQKNGAFHGFVGQNTKVRNLRRFILRVRNLRTIMNRGPDLHVISRKRLLEAAGVHGDLAAPLDVWYRVAKRADWNSLKMSGSSFLRPMESEPIRSSTSRATVIGLSRKSTIRRIDCTFAPCSRTPSMTGRDGNESVGRKPCIC